MKKGLFKSTDLPATASDKTDQHIFRSELFAANGSNKGEVLLQWDAVSDAGKYIVELSGNRVNGWEQVDIVNDSRCIITGLRPGRNYSFRVAAVFEKSISRWSNHVSKKVK